MIDMCFGAGVVDWFDLWFVMPNFDSVDINSSLKVDKN